MRRFLARLNRIEELSLSLLLLGLAAVGFVQVFFRYALQISFDWYEEAGRYLGVLVTFMGAGLGVKYGVHFSMDILSTSLRRPWNHLLKALIGLISGSAFVIIVYYGYNLVVKNYGYETTSPVMQVPMYLAYLPIPLFSLVIAFRFFKNAVIELRRMADKKGERL